MSTERQPAHSRRDFIGHVGHLGMAAAVGACAGRTAPLRPAGGAAATTARPPSEAWDMSWVQRIAETSDRAVFDVPSITGGAMLDIATRYLDNCDAVYGPLNHRAIVVLNVRTRAVALALTNTLWNRFALGEQYEVKDPATQLPATRNPFLEAAPGAYPGAGSINALVARRAIVLVCDFALGHLATRLAAKAGGTPASVHRELREGFVPGAIAVPSGIFGLARAQNAGCALVGL